MRRFRCAALAAFAVFGFASFASAADLPVKAPQIVTPPAFNWTGFYVGIVGGYGSGTSRSTPTGFLAGGPITSINVNGGLIGGRVGYDYDTGRNLVLGAFADFSWSRVQGKICVETGGCTGVISDSYARSIMSWLSTIQAKAGYAPNNAMLFYATGGLAMARSEGNVSYLTSSSDPVRSDTKTRTGWAVGAGMQYKLMQSISLGAEYTYADLGNKDFDYSNPPVGVPLGSNSHLTDNLFRASLNYHFH
jgi:outer membrane immunogenic protein